MMHNCPHCHQELATFAFYCPRCQRPVGALGVEGVMLVVWWLDANGAPTERWGKKALKRGTEDLDLISVSPERPSAVNPSSAITFTVRLKDGPEQAIKKNAVEVFEEVSRPEMQEWQIR